MSKSLRSLRGNEHPWANRSGHSEEMSDREGIAQVTQRKWVTVSESLRSLKTNEQQWAICLGRSQEMSKWAIRSKFLVFSMFYIRKKKKLYFLFFGEWCERFTHDRSFPLSNVSKSLISLKSNERCEQITQDAHQKWANKWIAHFFEQIAHSLIFGQKTSNSLGNQMSEFPALFRITQDLRKCQYVLLAMITVL